MSAAHEAAEYPGDSFVKIGSGKGFQAYRDVDEPRVVKVSHDTFSRSEARRFRDILRQELELIETHLGGIAISTEIDMLSIGSGLWVVEQQQPFMEGVSVECYLASAEVDDTVIDEITEVYQRSRQMRRETGHMPDLWGRPGGLPRPAASHNLLVGTLPGQVTDAPVLVDVNFGSKQRCIATRSLVNVPQSLWLGSVVRRLS